MSSVSAHTLATNILAHLGQYRRYENDMSNSAMGNFVRDVIGVSWQTDHIVIARHEEVIRKTPSLSMEADFYRCHPNLER